MNISVMRYRAAFILCKRWLISWSQMYCLSLMQSRGLKV